MSDPTLTYTVVSSQYTGYICGQQIHVSSVVMRPSDGGVDAIENYMSEGDINLPFDVSRNQYQPGDIIIRKFVTVERSGGTTASVPVDTQTRDGAPVKWKRMSMIEGLNVGLYDRLQHTHACASRSSPRVNWDGHSALCVPMAHDLDGTEYVWPHALVYDAYWKARIVSKTLSPANMIHSTVKECDVETTTVALGCYSGRHWTSAD